MKILFVLEYYHPHIGGVEKLFKELAEALVMNDHEVKVITNSYNSTLKRNEFIKDVEIERLRFYNRFLFTFFSIPHIIKVAKDYDIIHTTSYNAAIPAWIAAKISQKKVIITFHEVWGKLWFKLPFINLIQKSIYWVYEYLILKLNFDHFIAVSNATKNSLIEKGIRENKITTIYNGIEYPKVIPKKNLQEDFTFTYLGRIGISKGLEILIPTAKKFIDKYPNSKFKFITPTTPFSLYRKIEHLIRKTGLNKHIKLLHNLNKQNIEKELLSSHCIVIPSHSEGFCFVAAESISLGIPVISSGKAALKEVVSGKMIELKNLDEENLFQSLMKAMNNKFRETPIKEFHLKNCIENYLLFYKKMYD